MSLTADLGVDLEGFHLDFATTVPSGVVVALVGPNGSGKTTVLRAVAGLTPIDRGAITIDGRTVDDPDAGVLIEAEHRSVGVVFQEHLLFPHLSARDNVAFGLRARGARSRDARATADQWLARVGVAHRADARPAELSGGQSQRVALARALATEPRVLLLDEPFAALDAAARDDLRPDLRDHLRQFDGATLVVTHDPMDAALLADEVIILVDGRIEQVGSVTEVLARPRSHYVADLVGVNLLEGVADDHDVRLAGDRHVTVAEPARGRVFVGIDPRAVVLSLDPPHGSARNTWPCRVVGVGLVGERARVRLTGPVPLVAEVTAAAVAELGLVEGLDVWASVKATELHVAPG